MGVCKICEKQRDDRELMDGRIVFEGTTIYGVCVKCQMAWRKHIIDQIKDILEEVKDNG